MKICEKYKVSNTNIALVIGITVIKGEQILLTNEEYL